MIHRNLLPMFLFVFLISANFAQAELKTFTRSFSDKFPEIPRLYEVKNPKKLKPLARIKWFSKNKQWKSCLQLTQNHLKTKDLQLWVSAMHLFCLKSLYEENRKVSSSQLIGHFKKVELYKEIILSSPFEQHKKNLLAVFLGIAEKSLNGNRSKIDNFLSQNYNLIDHMEDQQRARYYRLLGEIAWQRQKNNLAVQNFYEAIVLTQ